MLSLPRLRTICGYIGNIPILGNTTQDVVRRKENWVKC